MLFMHCTPEARLTSQVAGAMLTPKKEVLLSDKVYKKIRVVGCSSKSFEKAVELAVSKAGGSVHGIAWFEVIEFRGAVRDGKPVEWQVTVDLGFKVD